MTVRVITRVDDKPRIYDVEVDDFQEARLAVQDEHPKSRPVLAIVPKHDKIEKHLVA